MLGWFGLRSSDEEFAPAATWPPVSTASKAPPEAPRPRFTVATALVVAGISWFLAGMLAMHVFGALPHIHSMAADVVFHGSGLWLATAGLALHHFHRPSPIKTAPMRTAL